MNLLKAFLDSQRKHFAKGGKFERGYPLFESIESVFYSLDRVTEKGPHVRDSLDVKRFMTIVIFTLLPLLFFGIYNAGYQSHLAAGKSLHFGSTFISGIWIVQGLIHPVFDMIVLYAFLKDPSFG